MAEEKKIEVKSENHATGIFGEMIGVFIVLFILMSLLSGLSGIFGAFRSDDGEAGSSWFSRLSLDSVLRSQTTPISSSPQPIGSKFVVTKSKTAVYDSPGGKEIDTKGLGKGGTIIGGPTTVNGVKYWEVRFDDGTEGWVKEDDLGYVEDDTTFLFKLTLFLIKLVSYLKYIIWALSGLLILWIIYLFMKINSLASEKRKLLYPEVITGEELKNPKWQKVLEYSESLNENDWRLAILEADIMLDELLEKMGLPGETIGDRLKVVEKSDFRTLDNAWEAHKFRNEVAHQGSSFLINQREVKRVIALYQSVFEEFEII